MFGVHDYGAFLLGSILITLLPGPNSMFVLTTAATEGVRRGYQGAAGVFVSFTPLFGLHLFGSMALAWAIGGNVLAGVIGSFVGNPVTIPFIALMSLALGRWILDIEGRLTPIAIFDAFAVAGRQLTGNLLSPWSGDPMEWDQLHAFGRDIFLPYLIGGIVPGLTAAIVCHYLTVPLVEAYHRRRDARLRRRAS